MCQQNEYKETIILKKIIVVNTNTAIKINNECLKYVERFKYLGVIIDSQPNFQEHARYILY